MRRQFDERGGVRSARAPPKADRLRSLCEFLREVPEFRKPRGVRHQLATVLAIALAGKLAGVRGVVALGEFAGWLTQTRLAAVQASRSPRCGRLEAPSASSFHRILSSLDLEGLNRAMRRWTASRQETGGIRGAELAPSFNVSQLSHCHPPRKPPEFLLRP